MFHWNGWLQSWLLRAHMHLVWLPLWYVAVSTAISAKNGLLIRNRANFEEGRNLNAVVFDKTGTLTEGKFGVMDIVANEGYTDEDVLRYGASLEQQSEHPIAVGLVKSAQQKS